MSRIARFAEFGPASVLRIEDETEPHAGPGQVRVAVKAASLNPVDFKLRKGDLKDWIPITPPSTIGNDYAGVIDEIGEGAIDFTLDDEVFGGSPFSAIADFLVVEPSTLARKPANVDWDVAGSIQTAGTTGYNSANSLNLTPDDTVLVSAAAGGVGVVAAQIAKLTGATVIGTASEANHEYLRTLGIIPIAYGPGLADRIRAVAPQGITAALENYGSEAVEAALELGVPKEKINTVVGDFGGWGIANVGSSGDTETLTAIAELISTGKLDIPIEASYPLEEIVAAHEHLESGHLRGKITLDF